MKSLTGTVGFGFSNYDFPDPDPDPVKNGPDPQPCPELVLHNVGSDADDPDGGCGVAHQGQPVPPLRLQRGGQPSLRLLQGGGFPISYGTVPMWTVNYFHGFGCGTSFKINNC